MAGEPENQATVTDVGSEGWSDLFKKEDYWAMWLGFILIVAGMIVFLPLRPDGMQQKIDSANAVMEAEGARASFHTVAWHEASDSKLKIKASGEPIAKSIAAFTAKPHKWANNPLTAFVLSEEAATSKKNAATEKYEKAKEASTLARSAAVTAEGAARRASFQNEELNTAATVAIEGWRNAKKKESGAKKKTRVTSYNLFGSLASLGLAMAIFFGVGMKVMGKPFGRFFVGFLFVFFVAVLSYLFSQQQTMKQYGIGYAAWAIAIGLLISNTVGTPKWVMPAVKTEYFIKTGLVLLGAEILFGKILTIGVPGIFVAWVVTPIVLVSTYMFGQRVLQMPSKTLNITICADMSVCGVSAAIATAAACRAKKEELTLAVGLSLVFTSIMMVLMPTFIGAIGMPEILGGAWMGGTIDATGAVAAAGAFLGEKALYTAATVKMIQNVLIGVIAFCVALYWTARVENAPGSKVSAMEIWYRFPKFVIGFITASVVFSLIYGSLGPDAGYTLIDNGVIRGFTKTFRGWFFCLAFVSIGLATNFRELARYFRGGKPLILYVCGQTFNLLLTLFMAWVMFYKVFPHITARL